MRGLKGKAEGSQQRGGEKKIGSVIRETLKEARCGCVALRDRSRRTASLSKSLRRQIWENCFVDDMKGCFSSGKDVEGAREEEVDFLKTAIASATKTWRRMG